jgi:hypothetical protein
MTTGITRRQTPEERELAKKQAELVALETRLAQRELELATLQAELQAFEAEYLRRVGSRYAKLDMIEAQIAELEAELHPQDSFAQEQARHARSQAQESARAVGDVAENPSSFSPSDDLKALFRYLAKLFHPDLSTDPAERERRTRFMAEANAAYRAGDEGRLQALLREWENSHETVTGNDVGSELIRLIRKIAQVEERLEEIASQIQDLEASEINKMRSQVFEAAANGRDVFAEMTAQVEALIAKARLRLDVLMQNRKHS